MADSLLDTNVLIFALRGHPVALRLLNELNQRGSLFISVATRVEILAGMHSHEEQRTLNFLQTLTSLPITVPVSDKAGRWIYAYTRQGIQLSFPDVLIAATAWHHKLALATTNPKHFPMPEIQLFPILL